MAKVLRYSPHRLSPGPLWVRQSVHSFIDECEPSSKPSLKSAEILRYSNAGRTGNGGKAAGEGRRISHEGVVGTLMDVRSLLNRAADAAAIAAQNRKAVYRQRLP